MAMACTAEETEVAFLKAENRAFFYRNTPILLKRPSSVYLPRVHVLFAPQLDTFALKVDVGMGQDPNIAARAAKVHDLQLAPSALHKNSWIVDSGCTLSSTCDKRWFIDFFPTTGSITVGNGATLPIQGYGTVRLETNMYHGSRYDPKATSILSTFTMSEVLYCPDLQFNLLSISQGLKEGYDFHFPAVNRCQIIAPSKDWYMMAPHDKQTALFCLYCNHTSRPLNRGALYCSVTSSDYEALFKAFRKLWESWFNNPNIDTNLGGALHPMYRRPPKDTISSVAARIFHPTIVEHEYPILRTVCTSILSLTTPDNPDFRLNRMLVGLLGESRLTNEAIVRLWHRRLGHPGDTVLNELINLNPDLKHLRGRRLPQLRCDSCRLAKSVRQPFKDRAVFRATYPGQRIVSDIWGPF